MFVDSFVEIKADVLSPSLLKANFYRGPWIMVVSR